MACGLQAFYCPKGTARIPAHMFAAVEHESGAATGSKPMLAILICRPSPMHSERYRCNGRSRASASDTSPSGHPRFDLQHDCVFRASLFVSMAPKRQSGRHKPGSRTRAAGYMGASGWPKHNTKLDAEVDRRRDKFHVHNDVQIRFVTESHMQIVLPSLSMCHDVM